MEIKGIVIENFIMRNEHVEKYKMKIAVSLFTSYLKLLYNTCKVNEGDIYAAIFYS